MKVYGIVIMGLLISSCSTPVTPQPDGRDRYAATVDFSYTIRGRSRAVIDWVSLQEQAVQRCAEWDYQYAMNKGEPNRVCVNRSNTSAVSVGIPGIDSSSVFGSRSGNCQEYKHIITYQCTNVIE